MQHPHWPLLQICNLHIVAVDLQFIGITGKGSPDGFISYTASQPNARSRHVAADEITRERAIRANIRI